MLGDAAHALEHAEDRRRAERGFVDLRAQAVGDAAGNIFIEAAARDVADAVDVRGVHRGEDGLHVDLRRAQQLFAQRAAELVDICAEVRVLNVEDLAHKGIAVGVDTA